MKMLHYHFAILPMFGVSNENRTHDSGITTRGFTTKLWTPYRNTLLKLRTGGFEPLSAALRSRCPFQSGQCVFIWQTHCGQDSNLHVASISTGPHNGPMSTIPSPRVLEVNYSPIWVTPADVTYHIETHCPTCAG